MYDVGEKVVIKESMKQGVVSGVNEENQKVEIRYEDGSSQWVDLSSVAKLLLDDAPQGNFLQD